MGGGLCLCLPLRLTLCAIAPLGHMPAVVRLQPRGRGVALHSLLLLMRASDLASHASLQPLGGAAALDPVSGAILHEQHRLARAHRVDNVVQPTKPQRLFERRVRCRLGIIRTQIGKGTLCVGGHLLVAARCDLGERDVAPRRAQLGATLIRIQRRHIL